LSSIKVEKRFKNSGVQLSGVQRKESVRIFSSSDFRVEIDYEEGDRSSQGQLKYQVTRADHNSNDYNLTVYIPNAVSGFEDSVDFKATLILIHPYTNY